MIARITGADSTPGPGTGVLNVLIIIGLEVKLVIPIIFPIAPLVLRVRNPIPVTPFVKIVPKVNMQTPATMTGTAMMVGVLIVQRVGIIPTPVAPL